MTYLPSGLRTGTDGGRCVGGLRGAGHTVEAGVTEGQALLALYDWKADAFGGPPFVPRPAAAEFLLALGLRTGTKHALKASLRSLVVLPKSELSDPVEGGFFERCEAAPWKRPHTRKTLAGNAALLQAFSTAAAWTGDVALRRAAEETAAFIDKRLKAEEGDLWAGAQGPDDEYFEKMGHARGRREAPPAQGSATPAANAAAISAFVRAGICLDEPRWIGRARLAGRELMEGSVSHMAEPAVACAMAAQDLEVATGDIEWTAFAGLCLTRALLSFAQGKGSESRAAVAAKISLAMARNKGAQEPGRPSQGIFGGPHPEPAPDDIDALAALGMERLSGAVSAVGVLCRGAPVAAPGSHVARAAVAGAWALGLPRVEVAPPREGGPAQSSASFFVPGKESPAITDPARVKEFLRGVVALEEAI
jgi:hypothetical protein